MAVETYWQALLRDVPFSQYAGHPLAAEAAADLRRFDTFADVTPATLFRGLTAGERVGPYLSQFLWAPIPYGPLTIAQQYRVGAAGFDFMTSKEETVRIQRGLAPTAAEVLDPQSRYLRNGRDLAGFVFRDFSYQAFLNAALILLGHGPGAIDDGNPYKAIANQASFLSFGGPDILSSVADVACHALRAAWYQKWAIHRVLRPEAFGLRVHNTMTGAKSYPIHPSLFSSPALSETFARHGSYLLPMAYAVGSPTHPSYVAGHAAIAGACVTVLKAFFKEGFVLPNTVVANDEGTALQPLAGTPLTLGGELDKLAANIALGRDIAGVHYWSDGIEGLNLGEQVALSYLADLRSCYSERFDGFSLTRFDGTSITV